MSFELDRKSCKLVNFNPRAELHGEDREPAADLKIELRCTNEVLAEFHPSLRSALYKAADAGSDLADQGMDEPSLPSLKFPKMGSWKWDLEIVGCTLTIHYGTGGKSDIVLPDSTADQFGFVLHDGGMVDITFRVRCHPDEKQAGKIYTLQQREIEVTLEPPSEDQERIAA